MGDFLQLYHIFVLCGLLLALATVVANLACFDGLRAAPPPAGFTQAGMPAPQFAESAPLISVLVPARNEARNVKPCVRSLLAQDYPNFELIVLDDHSEDATAAIVRGLGLGESTERHRLIHGDPLPAGWTGKGWACHQLASTAKGDFLFFTDADTEHAPGTLSALLAYAERHRADLLSAWPRLITRTWGERLVIPMILFLGMILYPHWLVLFLQEHPRLAGRLPRSVLRALGAANGQSMFFRRPAYERIGGHAALHHHLVEDVALGRAITLRMGEGMRLFNCEALRFSTCRMYRCFPEVWEGFTKNLRAAFEDSLGAFVGLGIIQTCGFLLPFFLLPGAGAAAGIVAAQIGIIFLIRGLLTFRFKTSWLSCIAHPLSEALLLAIGLNSWRRMAGKGVTWKGRTYPAGQA